MINKKDLYLGDSLINSSDLNIEGKEVVINNENFYKISNVNKMRPFFMSIVSAYDHWLFISSTGALSAEERIVITHYFLTTLMIKLVNLMM
jgi:hypothetical protein